MDEYNHKLAGRYNQLRNVNDIHIQLDVLSTTPEGVYQLKEVYAKLIKKFYLEKEFHTDLEAKY